MGTKKFFKLKFMISFFFLAKTSFTLACNKEFLRSYHLKGNSHPQSMVLEMCSGMELSCCRQSDQMAIYNQWKTKKKDKKVQKNFALSYSYYYEIMKIFLRTEKIAESVLKHQKNKQFSNCKTMAERITSYDIKDTYKDILKNFRALEDFFITTYNGFFCSACDAVNHKFLDDTKAKIYFSKNFCRSMITNITPALIYMHEHIPVLANLVGTFLNSCDKKGEYGFYKVLPKKIIFVLNKASINDLSNCKANRNERNWFLNCKNICKKFNFVNMTSFFIGDLKTISDFNNFANIKIHEIEGLKGKVKVKKFVDIKSMKIFSPVEDGQINISGFAHEFVDHGFSPYVAGHTAMVSKIIFEQVKNSLDYKKKEGIKEFSFIRKFIYIFGTVCFLII